MALSTSSALSWLRGPKCKKRPICDWDRYLDRLREKVQFRSAREAALLSSSMSNRLAIRLKCNSRPVHRPRPHRGTKSSRHINSLPDSIWSIVPWNRSSYMQGSRLTRNGCWFSGLKSLGLRFYYHGPILTVISCHNRIKMIKVKVKMSQLDQGLESKL